MRARWIVLAALAVAGGLWWHRAAGGTSVRATWEVGTQFDYALAWSARGSVAAAGDGAPQMDSAVDLTATLRLVGHGPHGDGWLVAASLTEVARADVQVLGRNVFADAAAAGQLVGPTAWVLLDGDGRVERIHFDAAAPRAFKHLMQTLVGLAQVTAGDGDAWDAVEPGPSGIARVRYARSDRRWERERVAYDRFTVAPTTAGANPALTARADIVIDAGGHLISLVDNETLTLRVPGAAPLFHGTSRFALTLAAVGRASVTPPPALAGLESRTPGEPVQGGDVDQELLAQRAAGLTPGELHDGLRRSWAASRSEKRRWLHRAAALLQLQPELCATVVAAFADGEPHVRLLAFDLLASAGTTAAQAAMREAFALPGARPLDVELVQRFSFLAKPDAETVQFISSTWRRERAGTNQNFASATTYTIGAIARRLGATPQAAELGAALRDALANARSDRDREDAIAALGNTARTDNVAVLRGAARAGTPEVRSRAAWALRDMATGEARGALVELAGDADTRVARAALAAMGRQTLGAGDLEQLERTLHGPRSEGTTSALVDLLQHHLTTGAAPRRMLEAIAADSSNSNLVARARVLLSQI